MDTEDKKNNVSLVNVELPKSLDNAIENLTNEPTGRIGQFTADIFDLIMYPVHGVAERKRIKEDEKTEKFAIESQKRIEAFKEEINQKYNKIPIENRTDPTEKTLSALDDSKYCLEDAEIRKMFANLISKSMDSSHSDEIYPFFSAIIKQLSSKDAKVFKQICQLHLNLFENNKNSEQTSGISETSSSDSDMQRISYKESFYIFNLSFVTFDNINVTYNNIIDINDMDINDISLSIDNLLRCNLIFECNSRRNGMFFPSFRDCFNKIVKWDCVKRLIEKGNKLQDFDGYEICLSELGKKFYTICCEDEDGD